MSMEKALKSFRPTVLPRTPPPEPSKSAEVEAYRQFTRIVSQATYGAAYPDPKGVEYILPNDISDQDLGEKAHAALAASRFLTPDHPEFKEVMRFPTKEEEKAYEDQLLKAAGVKTLRTLYKGAQSVFLDLQDGVISIDSWKYRYAGHWEGIRGLAPITVPESVGDIEFGQAIRAGLAKSF